MNVSMALAAAAVVLSFHGERRGLQSIFPQLWAVIGRIDTDFRDGMKNTIASAMAFTVPHNS